MATNSQKRGCAIIIALLILGVSLSWLMRGMHWLLVWVDRALSGVMPASPVYSWTVFGAIIGLVLYAGMHGAKARRATLRPAVAVLIALGLVAGGRFFPVLPYYFERTWASVRPKPAVPAPNSAVSNPDQSLTVGSIAIAAEGAASTPRPITPPPVPVADPSRIATPQVPERQPTTVVTAKSVLERYVRETGGRKAREAVRSLQTRAKVTGMWGDDFVIATDRAQFPDRQISRWETSKSTLIFEQALVGDVAWQRTPSGLRLLTQTELTRAVWALRSDEVLLTPELFYTSMTVEGINVDINGVSSTQLMLDGPMGRSTQYFSNGSGLLLRDEGLTLIADKEMRTITDFSDYRDQGGLLVPHVLRIVAGELRVTFEMVDIKINVAFPVETFLVPDDVKALVFNELPAEARRELEAVCKKLYDEIAWVKKSRGDRRNLIERGLANADSPDASDRKFVEDIKDLLAAGARDERARLAILSSDVLGTLQQQPHRVRVASSHGLARTRTQGSDDIAPIAARILSSAVTQPVAVRLEDVEAWLNAAIPPVEVPSRLKK